MPGYLGAVLSQTTEWREIETRDDLRYKFFPASGGAIQFKVKAAQNAYIALTTELQEAGPMYELIIGCSGNTISAIRKNRMMPHKVEVSSPGILNNTKFCDFWINWNGSNIYAGCDNEPLPFISWYDPEPIPIMFCGVCTGYGATGSWQIQDVEIDGKYQFFPITNSVLRFKVKTPSDVYIVLTTEPKESDMMYELRIGKSLSRISKSDYQKPKVERPYPLPKDWFVDFFIHWYDGTITIQQGTQKPILTWTDEEAFPVFYCGISTRSLQLNGFLKYDASHGYPRYPPSVNISCAWVDAADGQVPPNAVIGGYHSSGESIYIARITVGRNKYPGTLIPSQGGVVFGDECVRRYQVLVRSPSYNWVATSGNNIPSNAYLGGISITGEVLYIGRVRHENLIIIGRVQKSTGKCYVSIEGKEAEYHRYEVLAF